MIYFLKGIVEEQGADHLALDVNGVGYLAYASSRLLGATDIGEVVKLYVYTNFSEMAGTTLYAFQTLEERTLFETLLSVSGAGAKVGLALFSSLSPADIVQAITLQDGKMLTVAKGVGPKLGERIVRELKGKVGALPEGANGGVVHQSGAPAGAASEAVSALTNLGYRAADAQKAVNAVVASLGEESSFDVIFKASLQELR